MVKKVIVADDDPMLRELLMDFLGVAFQKEGIEVEFDEASNGKELVEKVREGDYALVLTDNEMPGGNGLNAIREIRGYNEIVPIYMLSGSDVSEEALKAGATGYFAKPIKLSEIIEGTRNAIMGLSRV